MMASGKNAKRTRAVAPVVNRRLSKRQGLPWLTIGAFAVVLLLVGGIFAVVYNKNRQNNSNAASVAPFQPSATNKDPSTAIPGIFVGKATTAANGTLSFTAYKAAMHVTGTQRVAYDRYPPIGGPHDEQWAACNGDIYATAVRNENMVHPLEHGAVWITYNPATIAAGDLEKLKTIVSGQSYEFMSPYPSLDSPISLQSWAHQLKLTSAADVRIQQFITALRQNPHVTPEAGASCSQPGFAAAPPPFNPVAPGADAIKMDGAGLAPVTNEAVPNVSGAAGSAAPASGASSSGAAGSAATLTSPAANTKSASAATTAKSATATTARSATAANTTAATTASK